MDKEALKQWSGHSENAWEGFLAEECLCGVNQRRTSVLSPGNFLEAQGDNFVPNMNVSHDGIFSGLCVLRRSFPAH